MHRARILSLVLLASPAAAWEFTPGTPCLLTHTTPEAEVTLTYDPTAPLYSISITQEVPFRPGAVFSMQFDGPVPLSISTDQHRYSDEGRTLSVTDTGFGNVLNGLQFNQSATARLGDQAITIPTRDAADAVAAFRACDAQPAV